MILDKDKTFTLWHYCETAYTTINFGSGTEGYILKIYDENGNLYLTRTMPSSGSLGPLILNNITYTFEKLNQNGQHISSITKKLILEQEIINL